MKAPYEMSIYGKLIKVGQLIRLRATPWKMKADKKGAIMAFLKEIVRSDSRVLEFGSGGSTVWYAKRAARVDSYESEKLWFEIVGEKIEKAKLKNMAIFLRPNYPTKGVWQPKEAFDLVLIDGINRYDCVRYAMVMLKPRGWLMVMDTNSNAASKIKSILTAASWQKKALVPGHRAAWRKPK